VATEVKLLSRCDEEVLRARADSLAQESLDDHVGDSVATLLFRLGEEWYAFRLSDVREIHREYRLTPLPCVPDFVLGVVSVRGEILSVSDLARMMHLGAVSTKKGQPPAVVLADDISEAAIVVDEIGDIADIPIGSIEPPLSMVDRLQAPFVNGTVELDGKLVGLVDAARVLEPVGGSVRT
jgi:purine-binding chemotaxis protein CheW